MLSRPILSVEELSKRQDPLQKNVLGGKSIDWSPQYAAIHESRLRLPVFVEREGFLKRSTESQVIVISASTGSGKTLQIPQMIAHSLDHAKSKKTIILTQPRIIAASEVSSRLAVELDSELGTLVTLQTSKATVVKNRGENAKIRVMTDGLLVSMMLSGDIGDVDVIILDEIHERGTNMDLCMGLIKRLLRERPQLQLVLMSATGKNDVFMTSFEEFTPIHIEFSGRPQDIKDIYLDETNEVDWAHCMTKLIRRIVVDPESVAYKGDILGFCPGKREIQQMIDYIDMLVQIFPNEFQDIEVFSLYRDMPASEQQDVLENKFKEVVVNGVLMKRRIRKIILATNIAETSITLPELDWVIDSGYSKVAHYLPEFDARELVTCRCSWAQCWQRRGRVGRRRRGAWIILMSEETFQEMREYYTYPLPPVLRSDVTGMMLRICADKGGYQSFEWITRPTEMQLARANDNLCALGFLSTEPGMKLTEQGMIAAKLSMSPFHAKLFLGSKGLYEVVALVALLESGLTIRQYNEENQAGAKERVELFEHAGSDHLTELELFLRWKEHQAQETDVKFARKTYISWPTCKAIDRRIEELREVWKGELGRGDLVEFTREQQKERVKLLSLHLLDAYASKLAILRNRPGKKREDEDDTRYWVNIRSSNVYFSAQPMKLRRSSLVKHYPFYLIYTSLEYKSGTGVYEMEQVTTIEESWLQEWDPAYTERLSTL